MERRRLTPAIGVVVVAMLLLAVAVPACSGEQGGAATFCGRIGSLSFDALGHSGIDVSQFRAARDELAKLHPPAELQADVKVLIALYDLVIDRFGGIDLANPDTKELAAITAAQQELEAQLIANEAALNRIKAVVAACPTTTNAP